MSFLKSLLGITSGVALIPSGVLLLVSTLLGPERVRRLRDHLRENLGKTTLGIVLTIHTLTLGTIIPFFAALTPSRQSFQSAFISYYSRLSRVFGLEGISAHPLIFILNVIVAALLTFAFFYVLTRIINILLSSFLVFNREFRIPAIVWVAAILIFIGLLFRPDSRPAMVVMQTLFITTTFVAMTTAYLTIYLGYYFATGGVLMVLLNLTIGLMERKHPLMMRGVLGTLAVVMIAAGGFLITSLI